MFNVTKIKNKRCQTASLIILTNQLLFFRFRKAELFTINPRYRYSITPLIFIQDFRCFLLQLLFVFGEVNHTSTILLQLIIF